MTNLDNLSTAYAVITALREKAEAAGLASIQMIDPSHGGQVYFSLREYSEFESIKHFLRGIDTTAPTEFADKADAFLEFWYSSIEDKKSLRAQRVAALKAELAKLEGE